MVNILDLTLDELKDWMKNNGESSFRAKQIMDWLYKGIWNFDDMKNIPSTLREKLKDAFYLSIPEVLNMLVSEKDGTSKFLLRYSDGNIIESVVMKYKHGNSICVSTQVGCKMGCKFCASTLEGVVRNLSSGEILSQILVCQNCVGERISNVVLMGSGEPLDNYENVIKFIKLANADYGLNIGQRHITLSTCGLVPKIYELADLDMQITLAISLHASNDELRKSTMPVAYKYSVKELIDACKYYTKKTNRRVTFEYALINNTNDSIDNARELAELVKNILCHVNLIPINEITEKSYKKSSLRNVENFYNTLVNYGIETTIRKEMGSDINAACGQLRRSFINKTKNKDEV
ncbi:23S rRNA methyltransferase [Clostridiales bacterium oral taxon 876 str. F0540]|nr:23S rRNA methyltransferase [Clostridiales bacterium oral taxon 876 str. F0540]